MMPSQKGEYNTNGFSVVDNVYSDAEINEINNCIQSAEIHLDGNSDLFAIRDVLQEIPTLSNRLFTTAFTQLVKLIVGQGAAVIKSIYFDKPEESNWFVAYHQDLIISVDRREELPEYTHWTFKNQQHAVQPPLKVLENIFTFRIHLDNATSENGALKVIPGSHLKGIYRPETIDWSVETEQTVEVNRGGVMLMKPLLLHSSARSIISKRRRVLHLEITSQLLPEPIQWKHRLTV